MYILLFESFQLNILDLLISGELDRNAPLPTVINAYNKMPRIIPNTGYVVFIENFPAVWGSIVPFLSQK